MDNVMQRFMPDSLMDELRAWNAQEHKLTELFSVQPAQDRVFQKMKLSEYDRLWHKYNGRAQTTDERALLVMLRYQRRKMGKALYPGLLSRLLFRGIANIGHIIREKQAARIAGNTGEDFFTTIPAPPRPTEHASQQQAETRDQRRRYGHDLGKRLKNGQGKHNGPSM